MHHLRHIWILGLLLFFTACGGQKAPLNCVSCNQNFNNTGGSLSPELELEARFVASVVLGSEYGGGDNVVRWTRSPTLSLFGANNRAIQAVESAMNQINSAIQGSGIRIRTAGLNNASADIKMAFGTASQLPQLGNQFGIRYIPGNSGFFTTFNNNAFELTNAVILVQIDAEVEHIVLEELTQVMGPMKDQGVIQDSIFFERPTTTGGLTQLSRLDRRLMAFLYRFLAPGDDVNDVLNKFVQVWTTPTR